MSHMQSVPGGVEQEALAEEKELAEGFRPEKGRRKIATGEGRLAFFLVTPTVLLLALIVGYPIVKAVINSFQKDPGLNPATGFFNKGGQFAGLDNYKTWLLQQCPAPGGGTVKCPPGTLASEFWNSVGFTLGVTIVAVALETVLGMIMALMMHKAFKGRGVVRAAILIPWAIPTAVSAKLWQVIYAPSGVADRILGVTTSCGRRSGRPESPSSSPTPGRRPRSWPCSSWPGCRAFPMSSTSPRRSTEPPRGSGSGGSRCHWSSRPWPSR